jgi:tetratricopeptide (TPR) repeat protein
MKEKLLNGSLRILSVIVGIAVLNVYSDDAFDRLVDTKNYSEALNYADAKIPAAGRDAKTWAKLGRANEGQSLIEKALACYMFATRLDPKNFDAELGMARVYNKLNQPANAATAAKKALELKFTGEASWEYGRACIALKQPADAKKAFEKVVETDPGNISAQWELGLIYYSEKAFDKAIDLIKSVYAKQPNESLALKIGQIYNEAGNVDSALVYLKGPNNHRVSLAEAGLELGRIYFKQQKFSEAAVEFERGTTKSGAEPMDFYLWAVSLEKSNGNPEKLTNAYRLAVEKFGSSKSKEALQSRLKLGQREMDKKNYQAAITQFQAIIAMDSDGKLVPETQSLLASAYEGAGTLDKAISCLEKILKQNPSDVQAYGHLGDLYTKDGNVEKARVMYEKMVSINPNDNKVQLILGDYYLKGKKYQEALKFYQRSYTMERNAKAAEGMAISAMALDKADVARDAAESAIRMEPSLWESRVVLSHIYLKERNFKEAVGQLEIVVKKDENNKEIWQQLAQCYDQMKDAQKLADADRRIISLDARNTVSRMRLARYALSQNDSKTALDLFKELSTLSPNDAEVFKNLYEIALSKGSKEEAIGYLKRYLAIKPGNARAQKDLGDIYYEKKMSDDALAAYRAAAKADPSVKGIYKRYSEIIMAKETADPAEVISVLSGAIASGEADANIYAALGSSYHKHGQCNKAIDMFQKALQLDPRQILLLTLLAECQAKSGNVKDAIITFEQAITMNTGAVQEYKALGDLYLQQSKAAQAVTMYKKYLEKRPGDNKVALLVAENSFTQKNYDDAIKYYDMVKNDEMKKSEYLFRFGQACYFSKNYRRAIDLCKLVIDLAPQNAEAYKMLFDMSSRDNGLKSDAVIYLKRYLALRPTDAPAEKNLGDMLYEQKDLPGALSAYRQALKADPSIKGLYKQYVELMMQRGTKEEIVKTINGAIAAGEADATMYNSLAALYQKQGNYAKAIEMFQKALQLDPKNLTVLSSLAQCQAKSGDLSQAVISYEQAIAMNSLAIAEHKALGDLYMQQNKKDQAMASYKKYLDKDQSDVACILSVADYEYKTKDFDEAIRFLDMLKGEETKKPSYLLLYGQACYQSKSCTKAAAIFKQLSTLTPGNPEVLKTLFDIANKNSNTAEALSALKKYVAVKPADAPMQKQLGDLLYEQKDMAGAMAAYAAALKADPSIRGIYKRYCEIASGRLPQEQMAVILNAAIKTEEADGAVYAALGSIYQKQNACDKAIPHFQKALQLNPRGTDILASLAACQAKTGALGDAVISYEQAVAMNPNAQAEYKALGDLYLKQNKSAQAVAMYRKYLEKSPNDYEVASIVGENAIKDKNYADAVKYLSIAQATKGNDSKFLFSFGEACYYDALNQSKNFKKPIELLERMRATGKANPNNPDVLKILADCYDRTGDTARAIAMYIAYTKLPGVKDQEASFRKAQLTEPSNPSLAAKMYEDNALIFPKDYRNFMHSGLYYAKRPATYDKAISLLKKCAAIADSIPSVWMELGQIYGKLGKNKDEVDAYRQFIQLDASNPDASGKIGEILLAKNNVNDAMVFLETANALKPNDPKFMMLLAQGYLQTDRPDQALSLLEKSEKLKPEDMSIKEQLYALYEKKGDSKNALNEMKQILDKKKDNKYLIKYAQALYANGVYAEAENAVKDIRATDPENLPALMLMGKIQGIQGKWDDALETYKEISYINPNFVPALFERAEIHLAQSKLQWAKTFYERALKADPKYVLAVIGLAKVARVEKNKGEYVKQIQNAQKMDPNNKVLLDEMQEGRKLLR